jgi:hypothetical protein
MRPAGPSCAVTIRGLHAPVSGAFSRDGGHFYVDSIAMGGLLSIERDPAPAASAADGRRAHPRRAVPARRRLAH